MVIRGGPCFAIPPSGGWREGGRVNVVTGLTPLGRRGHTSVRHQKSCEQCILHCLGIVRRLIIYTPARHMSWLEWVQITYGRSLHVRALLSEEGNHNHEQAAGRDCSGKLRER